MIRRPPRSTLTDTLFPCTTLFRSYAVVAGCGAALDQIAHERPVAKKIDLHPRPAAWDFGDVFQRHRGNGAKRERDAMRGGGPRKLQVTVFGNHAIEPRGADYARHADLATKALHPAVARADIGKGTGGESDANKNIPVDDKIDTHSSTA